MTMPTEIRLITGLRTAIDALAGRFKDAETQQTINAATALLNELELRTEREFYMQYLSRGISLLQEFDSMDAGKSSGSRAALMDQILNDERDWNDSGIGADVIDDRLDQLRQCFEPLVRIPAGNYPEATRKWATKVFQWEAELHQRAAQFKVEPVHSVGKPLTREDLQTYLRARFEDPSLEVTQFRPLIGGLQKLTVLFDIESAAGQQSLVLRGEQPDRFLLLDLGEIVHEYEMVRIAFDAGLPVAEPMWLEADASALGRRFMVSRKVEGKNYGWATGVEPMPKEVVRSFVETMAKMHTIPLHQYTERISRIPSARWLRFDTLAAHTLENVNHWRNMLELRPHLASPALNAVFNWLVDNVPEEDGEATIVHCDYGAHNALVHEGKVAAILDWESTIIGDPAEDLGYFLLRSGPQVDRAEAMRWYREAGGPEISEYRQRYYDVFQVQKLIVACLAAQAMYAREVTARNEWTPLAYQFFHVPLSMNWQELLDLAEAAK